MGRGRKEGREGGRRGGKEGKRKEVEKNGFFFLFLTHVKVKDPTEAMASPSSFKVIKGPFSQSYFLCKEYATLLIRLTDDKDNQQLWKTNIC